MRLFTAIELPPNVRGHLAGIQQRIRHAELRNMKVSWVRPENLHITLKFLGEVSPELCKKLESEILRRVHSPGLNLVIDGFECLPPRGPTRVIVAQVIGSIDALTKLHREIEEVCASAGFPRETRAFTRHVTLGRIKSSSSKRNWSDTLKRNYERVWPGPAFRADAFALIKSDQTDEGSIYTSIARFPTVESP